MSKLTEMKIGLLVLIGLPGSGKTTLAKYLVSNFGQTGEGSHHFVHVCYDDFIQFPNGNHEFEWKSARNSVSNKIERLVAAIKSKNVDSSPEEFKNDFISLSCWEGDFVLILDDNMYFKSMRYSFFQIAKKHGIGFCQVFLNVSLDSALVVNNLRGPDSKLPPHVIENMHCKLEPPNLENKWEKYSVELEGHRNLNDICYKIFITLNHALNNPFCEKDETEMKELSRIVCRKNVIHQVDLALRKIISCKVKRFLEGNSKKESKEYVEGLNLRKSEILSDIKSGNICLTNDVLNEINSDDLEKICMISFLDGYF